MEGATWIAAFDVDGTLATLGEPVAEEVRRCLRALRERGAHIVFASGKPCLYLAGFARALDCVSASLAGENGAEVWLDSNMPPTRITRTTTEAEHAALERIRARVTGDYGDRVFFQPNTVGVAVFPYDDPAATARAMIARYANELADGITTYAHPDCADFVVARFNKGEALTDLASALGIPMSRVAAVGDGMNDLPMLEVAACALWVGAPCSDLPEHARAVPDIHAAFAELDAFARSVGGAA